MTKKLTYIIVAIAVVAIAGTFIYLGIKDNGKRGTLDVPEEEIEAGVNTIGTESVQSIVENLSSPVEIAALMQSLGVPFSKSYVASTEYSANYSTQYSKAFALGVFGADLGYLNMYGKTGSVMDYLTTIKDLANDLKIGQFFDFSTLKRLATNNGNVDSLKYISTHSLNDMDKYLRQRKNGNLSALIIAGAWIEGIYITTQVAKVRPDQKLTDKIGEQQIILNDLMILLRLYGTDPIYKNYLNEFELIKSKFNDVKITFELGEPIPVEENGMLTIKQTSKSNVEITDAQLKDITDAVETVRNRLIRM